MNSPALQFDLFPAAAPSVPPWLDPAHVVEIRVTEAIDRDHVGAEALGRVGNNKDITVLTIEDADGEALRAETFTGPNAWQEADTRRNELWIRIADNRQASLF